MSVDITRATQAAIQGILNDPDGIALGRNVVPANSDELYAMVYYIVSAVLTELTEQAEVTSSNLNTPGVID